MDYYRGKPDITQFHFYSQKNELYWNIYLDGKNTILGSDYSVFSYDNNDNLISDKYLEYSNPDSEIDISYYYDEQDRLVRKNYSTGLGPMGSPYTAEYFYTNNRLSHEFIYDLGYWYNLRIYFYDKNGNITNIDKYTMDTAIPDENDNYIEGWEVYTSFIDLIKSGKSEYPDPHEYGFNFEATIKSTDTDDKPVSETDKDTLIYYFSGNNELALRKTTLQKFIENKKPIAEIENDLDYYLIPQYDAVYQDLLRKTLFRLSVHYFYKDYEKSKNYLYIALLFCRGNTEKWIHTDLSAQIFNQLIKHNKNINFFYLNSDYFREWEVEGEKDAPAYFITYNIACLFSMQKDTSSALSWLYLANITGFPGLGEFAATDPDLEYVREKENELFIWVTKKDID